MAGRADALLALEERVGRLESILGGARGSKVQLGDISGTVAALEDRVAALMATNPEVRELLGDAEFRAGVEQLDARQESAFAALPSEAKMELLMGAEGLMRESAAQLEQVDKLKQYAATESIQRVIDLSTASKLGEAKHSIAKQARAAQVVDGRVSEVLARYNNIVDLLSQRFLSISQQLDQWEQRV